MKKLIFVLLALASTFAFSQTTVAPFVNPKVQFFNGAVPCSGCLLSTFAAGQSTPLATYSESTGTTPNANPVVLDANGMASIYLTSASYKFVLKTAANVTIWTQDGVSWLTPLTTFPQGSVAGNFDITQPTAAINGANQSSFSSCIHGTFFNVASLDDKWCFQNVIGTGTSPTSTLTLTHSGSSGAATFSIPGNVSVGGTLGVTGAATIAVLNNEVEVNAGDNLQAKLTSAGSSARIKVAPGSTFTLTTTLAETGVHDVLIDCNGATLVCQTGATDCVQSGAGGSAGTDRNIIWKGCIIKPGSTSGGVAFHFNGANEAIKDVVFASNGSNRFTHAIQNDNDQHLVVSRVIMDSSAPVLQCDATFCGTALYGPGPNGTNAGIFWVDHSNFSMACSGNGLDNNNGNDVQFGPGNIIQAFNQFAIRDSLVNGFDDNNIDVSKVHIEPGNCTNPLFGISSSAAIIGQGRQFTIHGGQFAGNFPKFTVSGATGTTVYHYWVVVNNGANHSVPLAAGYVTNGNATIDGTHTIAVVWNKITNATSYDILRQTFTTQPRTAPFGTGNFAVTTAFLQASCGTSTCSFTDNVTAPAGYTVATNSGYVPTIPMWPGDLVLSPSSEGNIYTSGFASVSVGKNASGKIFICANGESSIVPCVSFVGINHQEFTTNNVPYSPTYDSAANVGLDPTHKPPAQLLMAETPFTSLAGTKGVVNYGGKAQQDAAGEIVTFYDDNFDKTFATASHRPTPDAGDGAICKDSTSGATMCDMAKTSWHSYINHVPTNGDTAWIEERTANLKQFKVIVNQINNKVQVASDFTVAANTSLQTITGLTWNIPATAINYSFRCSIDYSQATAAVSDAFGIQAATNAPTNIRASGIVYTAAGTSTSGTLSTLSTTTATNILTFTPSATATVFTAVLDGTIENPASANAVNIMVSTSNSADLITVKRGSYCQLF